MRFISLSAAVLCFLKTAADASSVNPENVSATSLGVLQPQDIGIQRLYRGRPLPHEFATYTLYYAQLELYRRTVRRRGDAIQGPLDISLEDQANLHLEIRSFEYGHERHFMTLGSSLYGIASMLQTMLNPDGPNDGFFELKWKIFRRASAIRPRADVPLGYLNVLLGGDRMFRYRVFVHAHAQTVG
ncbi:MAG: hypothetical protein Q9221_006490 [Calogaya cf. arnoldii]